MKSPPVKIIERIPGAKNPVGRQTVKQQISDKLAYMIYSGLLRTGDELPSERELANTLEVSRETVRAAVSELKTRGMIEVNQGARTRILGPNSQRLHESVSALGYLKDRSLEEVTEARAAIESQVIRLTATRITPAILARLRSLLEDQRSMLNSPVRFQISDQEFHETLYQACGNKLLANVVFDFYSYALEFRRLALLRPGAIKKSIAEHELILDALENQDPDAVVFAMRSHLEQVYQTTHAAMKT